MELWVGSRNDNTFLTSQMAMELSGFAMTILFESTMTVKVEMDRVSKTKREKMKLDNI